jgi:hypothetical protein
VLAAPEDESVQAAVHHEVTALCRKFPLYKSQS